MRLARARLGTEHERRTDLRSARACREHGRDRRAVGDAAGGDERKVRYRARQSQESQQAQLTAPVHIGEAAPMPACFDALADECVRTDQRSGGRLVSLGHRNPDRNPSLLKCAHEVGYGAAECERHDRHAQLAHHLEFRLQSVVVEARWPSSTP